MYRTWTVAACGEKTCEKKKKKRENAEAKRRRQSKHYLTKRIRKKNKLIKDKVQIENADIRIIKWPQQFHNKSYPTSCQPVIGG